MLSQAESGALTRSLNRKVAKDVAESGSVKKFAS